MEPLYIIKTGTTFPGILQKWGDFEDWVLQGLQLAEDQVHVVDVAAGDPLPIAETCGGAVLTGSHAMVTQRHAWSVSVGNWLPSLIEAGAPVLGICFGHQLLADALGGRVGFHPGGREIGTVDIQRAAACQADPLFSELPSVFPAHVTHAQTVLDLPPGATCLAANSFEPHHAFRAGTCAWGVQFHPEFHRGIMAGYLKEQAAELVAAGRPVEPWFQAIRDTPAAHQLLRRFASLAINPDLLHSGDEP